MSKYDGLVLQAVGHVTRSYGNLDANYDWSLPKQLPISGFEIGSDSLWMANQKLRAALAEAWKLGDRAKRLELARWYVAEWGGVKRNSQLTMEGYVDTDPQILSNGPLKGVGQKYWQCKRPKNIRFTMLGSPFR